jgi:hypothetical protein
LFHQKSLTRYVIYKTYFTSISVRNTTKCLIIEHGSNKRHTYLKDTDFALFYTQIYIKPMLLQNGPHHNLGNIGFDKNGFQIFLHDIYCKPLPWCILNGIDYSDISSLIHYMRHLTIHNDVIIHCDDILQSASRYFSYRYAEFYKRP